MAKKRAFISFDYDNDSEIKNLLVGQQANPDTPFEFKDASVKEHIDGNWIAKVKARMANVDVVIVLCGEKTHTAKGVAAELGIAKELGKPYFLLWGYSNKACTKPTSAAGTDKIYSWTWDNLKQLIGGAR